MLSLFNRFSPKCLTIAFNASEDPRHWVANPAAWTRASLDADWSLPDLALCLPVRKFRCYFKLSKVNEGFKCQSHIYLSHISFNIHNFRSRNSKLKITFITETQTFWNFFSTYFKIFNKNENAAKLTILFTRTSLQRDDPELNLIWIDPDGRRDFRIARREMHQVPDHLLRRRHVPFRQTDIQKLCLNKEIQSQSFILQEIFKWGQLWI